MLLGDCGRLRNPRRGGIGESDKTGSSPPVSHPVTPQDLHATILHAMGVPLFDATKNTGLARPQFSTGKPVLGLFG